MPIYAYRCSSCNHAQDILRKISDAPLLTCTACGQDTFTKQVTAAGFALKGSGWYVTDFRGEGSGSKSSDGTATAPKTSEIAPSSSATSPAASPATSTTAANVSSSSASTHTTAAKPSSTSATSSTSTTAASTS